MAWQRERERERDFCESIKVKKKQINLDTEDGWK
jgi:hypothetical protein